MVALGTQERAFAEHFHAHRDDRQNLHLRNEAFGTSPEPTAPQLHNQMTGGTGGTSRASQSPELKPSPWHRMPDKMLRARAKSELARLEYPDLLAGLYTPEELKDAKNGG